MFLLVPAHLGSPGDVRKTIVVVLLCGESIWRSFDQKIITAVEKLPCNLTKRLKADHNRTMTSR